MTVKDDMDHSNMHHASIYNFFHRFCAVFASDPVFSTYVYAPRVGPDLDTVLSAYNSAGLPGCVGSMDVVHVAWDKCPAAWFNLHCGRYGHPTVAFNCIVDNSLFFRGVCKNIIPFTIFGHCAWCSRHGASTHARRACVHVGQQRRSRGSQRQEHCPLRQADSRPAVRSQMGRSGLSYVYRGGGYRNARTSVCYLRWGLSPLEGNNFRVLGVYCGVAFQMDGACWLGS